MLLVLEWDSVRDFRHEVSSSRGRELKNPSKWNIEKIMFTLEKELDKVNSSKMIPMIGCKHAVVHVIKTYTIQRDKVYG